MFYKPDWDEAKTRWNAFWEREIVDRCCILAYAPRKVPLGPVPPERVPRDAVERLTNAELRMNNAFRYFATTYLGGEAVPQFWDNMGPGVVSALVGGSHVFDNDTVWFDRDPIIADWKTRKALRIIEDAPMMRHVRETMEYFSREGKGKCIAGMTDLGGSLDIAACLRGAQDLLLDLEDHPDEVERLVDEITGVWMESFRRFVEILRRQNEGYTAWMAFWSDKPWYPLQCDFSVMISPAMYERFVVPSLVRLTEFLDRSFYHLDGMGQLAHLDLLLDIPRLGGIEWGPDTFVDGGEERWFPYYRKIQAKGKRLFVWSVKPCDVQRLLKAVSPKGLVIQTGCSSEDEAKDLLEKAKRWCA